MTEDRRARAEEMVQLAVFRIGAEAYAIDILRIREIIQPVPITRVPKAPAFVEGVVELRGAVIPIVDLRKRFDLPAGALGRSGKYILVTLGQRMLGLIVDAVSEVLRVRTTQLGPPPELGLGAPSAALFYSGVCRHGGRLIMILDLDRILSSDERVAIGASAAAEKDER
jgi:purine-binding chemotaxis protein CheW